MYAARSIPTAGSLPTDLFMCVTCSFQLTHVYAARPISTAGRLPTRRSGAVGSSVRHGRGAGNSNMCALQCVAVCCSVLQCVAVCGRVLQSAAECCRVLQCVVE